MPSLPKMNLPVYLGAYKTNWDRDFRDPQLARPPPESSVTPMFQFPRAGHVKRNHFGSIGNDCFHCSLDRRPSKNVVKRLFRCELR